MTTEKIGRHSHTFSGLRLLGVTIFTTFLPVATTSPLPSTRPGPSITLRHGKRIVNHEGESEDAQWIVR